MNLLSWLFQDFNGLDTDPVGFINTIDYEMVNKVFYLQKLLENKYGDLHYGLDNPDFQSKGIVNHDFLSLSITSAT